MSITPLSPPSGRHLLDEDAEHLMPGAWWSRHGRAVMRTMVPLMFVVALVWLGYEFWRLLSESPPIWKSSPEGAVDLKQRYEEVHRWFAGRPVYGELRVAVYPPASYLVLWPFLGWLPVTPARWLWAVTALVSLAWLSYWVVRESCASTSLERTFVALIPLSMYATGAAIGNGQLIVHILPLLIAGILTLCRSERRWGADLMAAAFLLLALVKPSVSVPFFWLVLFVPGRLSPALLVSAGYCALTLWAASFQEPPFPILLRQWLAASSHVVGKGYANIYTWLVALGFKEWALTASLLILLALGLWIYRHRKADPWLLLGVTAVVARLWTYHGWYDDLLILLPIISLFRIVKRGGSNSWDDTVAGVLFLVSVVAMLAPGGRYVLPPPWRPLHAAGQVTFWMALLVFLLYQARREKEPRMAQ